MPGTPRTPHRKDAPEQTYADTVLDYLTDDSDDKDAQTAGLAWLVELANRQNRHKVDVMAILREIADNTGDFDPNSEIVAEVIEIAVAVRQAILGLLPRSEDPTDVGNPFNADTPVAAEARLEAIHRVEQAAQRLGKIVAMHEIDAGHVSRKRAADLLGVSQMTTGRWYKEYQEAKAEDKSLVHADEPQRVTHRKRRRPRQPKP